YAAESQGHAGDRAGERADRRRLGNAVLILQIYKDSSLRRPVRRSRKSQRHISPEVPHPRSLVAFEGGRKACPPQAGCRFYEVGADARPEFFSEVAIAKAGA